MMSKGTREDEDREEKEEEEEETAEPIGCAISRCLFVHGLRTFGFSIWINYYYCDPFYPIVVIYISPKYAYIILCIGIYAMAY